MAGETDFSAVNGAAKRVYDKSGMKKALPGEAILQQRIKFSEGEKVGEAYQISVVLRPPNGFTYSGSSGDARSLKAARNMVIKQAQVLPFELELREQFTLAALSRVSTGGDAAFANLAGEAMKAMKFSAANRLEMQMLNGQRSLGTVEAVTDLGSNSADITITAATWRPGLWWALGEGATLDSFTSTTKNNASGALVISGLTTASRKVRVTYTGTLASEVAADDVLYFEGAWDGTTYLESPGLLAQASNLTGTSLGLSATTYMNWKGNTFDAGGNITFDLLEQMCGQLRDRKTSGKITAYFANRAVSALLSELKALRIIDSSYSAAKGKVGHKGVAFETPDIGEVEIVGHAFMAESEGLLINEEDCERVGSSDITFGIPGIQQDAPNFERVQGTNYAECILFTDQATALKTPGKAMAVSGITFT